MDAQSILEDLLVYDSAGENLNNLKEHVRANVNRINFFPRPCKDEKLVLYYCIP